MIKIKGNVHYVGVNDRVKHRFEGLWALPHGRIVQRLSDSR